MKAHISFLEEASAVSPVVSDYWPVNFGHIENFAAIFRRDHKASMAKIGSRKDPVRVRVRWFNAPIIGAQNGYIMDVLSILEMTDVLLSEAVSLHELELLVEETLPKDNKCDRIWA